MDLVTAVDRNRQRRQVLDRSRARQRRRRPPGANPEGAPPGRPRSARASSESPHTNSSQSSGSNPAPSRCAGTVLNAQASRTPSGSRALMCSAAEPSSTSSIAIFPPANVTGTVRSIARDPALNCVRSSSSSGSTVATGRRGRSPPLPRRRRHCRRRGSADPWATSSTRRPVHERAPGRATPR